MRQLMLLIVAAALVLALVPVTGAAFAGQGGDKLGKHDRELLAEARAQGETTVTLLIAALRGANRRVVQGIESLGGTVRFREDDIDYIRAIVPIDKVEAAARLSGVEAVDLNEIIPLEDPRPDGIAPIVPQPPPGPGTPNNNPYMPIGDTGASQFMAANPTWDGRGVTIGILDTGASLDHPSLLTTSTGERKVVDWVTFTDPLLRTGTSADPTWVDMQNQVSGSTFTFITVTYTAPAAGSYRIGLFNERDFRLGGELGTDVNRDGNPTGSSGIFAVLWDTASSTVWVDTNQNNNFADDMPMTDYKVNYDVNYFGVDNPATAVAERIPFVVQTDGKLKFVNIGIVSGAHGSHVAGIAAGNSLFGGAMTGAAPGAKIVSVRVCLFITGCTSFALIEGMIYAAKQSNVDVINMSIGGLPALNDGNNARALLYNRLIETYKVQMFISAGNSGPGLNTVGDPSVATDVMSIGSSITKDGWQKNYGADAPEWDNLHHFTSRGPSEDGGFKPNVVAPGHAISSTPLWQPGSGLPYTLPPGYSLFNGTSMAAPQAAGAAALLISAAKQVGAQYRPDQLRQAMNSSARFLDEARFQAYDQGNGLIDVGAAWNLLKTNINTVDISSAVPVNTLLSDFLATPGVGVGIHDREGVTAGVSYVRTYTFVRSSGGSKPIFYNLSWVGNDDDTFSSASSIALPLNTPVDLDVTINPATPGAHSAILNLDDPGTAGIDYQTMNVVVASGEFTASGGYTVVKTGTLGRSQVPHYFFRIPASTPAFKVDFTGPNLITGTGQMRFLRWHPWGLGVDSNAVSNCYSPPAPGGCFIGTTPVSPTSRTVTDPQAGVWEVTVDARRSSDSDNAAYTLTASILGASVSPNPDVIPSATAGVSITRPYTITNLFGPFTGRAVGGGNLGSARRGVFSIANDELQVYPVVVITGSTSLRATIGSPSDPAADLDLFVYNCTSGTCVLAGQSADGDSEESVTIPNPAAGNWEIRIDGFAVPAGTTTYNYVDVFVNPAFGSVSVTDADTLRATGAVWTVSGSVVANAAPAAGRVLLGSVQVRTDTNVLVGSADVVIESVTP
ncbi:MAG TPA: S8 family serine peptidase [Anaerolineae bacterium]|nr:S8 family serine peptidase [Anaerolineae bacterium]